NALDAHLREICHELASADLSFGALAEQFWKSNGWRRLGYASEQQYARERLAMSSTSVRIKRAVARKTRLLPAVSQAVEQRRIGYFAALLLLRIATENTVDAWVARAAERT